MACVPTARPATDSDALPAVSDCEPSWVDVVVCNVIRQHFKTAGRRTERQVSLHEPLRFGAETMTLEDELVAPQPFDAEQKQQSEQILQQLLAAELTRLVKRPQHREIITRLLQDKSYQQIANELHMNMDTVGNVIYRVKQMLEKSEALREHWQWLNDLLGTCKMEDSL